jgi:hypothetical protein
MQGWEEGKMEVKGMDGRGREELKGEDGEGTQCM